MLTIQYSDINFLSSFPLILCIHVYSSVMVGGPRLPFRIRDEVVSLRREGSTSLSYQWRSHKALATPATSLTKYLYLMESRLVCMY